MLKSIIIDYKQNKTMNTEEDLDRPPTMRDLINLLSDKSSKNDIDEIKQQLTQIQGEQAEKITEIEDNLQTVTEHTAENTGRIAVLENTIESLKQDKLSNNICISGMPAGWEGNASALVCEIGKKLQINFTVSDFTSYSTTNGKFIIASFYNMSHKQSLLNKMRVKKSLMVEEVMKNIKSNNQLYINEHLTPHNSMLFQLARRAKKENKLASATSYGGKIRVRKHIDDFSIIVSDELHLKQIIAMRDDMDTSNESTVIQVGKSSTVTNDQNNNTVSRSVRIKNQRKNNQLEESTSDRRGRTAGAPKTQHTTQQKKRKANPVSPSTNLQRVRKKTKQ